MLSFYHDVYLKRFIMYLSLLGAYVITYFECYMHNPEHAKYSTD